MKLVKACIVMAALAAICVVPSFASASPELTHPIGKTLPAGTSVIATNVAHAGTPKIITFTTSAGPFECATGTLTGELTSNTGTHIAANITTGGFLGTPAESKSAHCASPLGNVTITPNHIQNTSIIHNNISSLPWCITANTLDDKFTVRGGKCSEATRPLTFVMHTPIGACGYQKASIVGTYTTYPVDAILTVTNQEFTKNTGSVFCPNSGQLDMAFTITTDNNHFSGEPLYIS